MERQKESPEVWFQKYSEGNNMAEEFQGSLPNTVGYVTVGVVQGASRVLLPIVIFSVAIGFTIRVIKIGNKIGGA